MDLILKQWPIENFYFQRLQNILTQNRVKTNTLEPDEATYR